MQRMIVKAQQLGANAIVGIRFSTSILHKVLLSYLCMAQQWLYSLKPLIYPIHLMHR